MWYGKRQEKSAFEHVQNTPIQIILRMRNVLSVHLPLHSYIYISQ